MPKSSSEPANLVLEHLRLMRDQMDRIEKRLSSTDEKIDREFKAVRNEISVIRRQTIGEVYKANKTFAGFADIEMRLEAVERKVFS